MKENLFILFLMIVTVPLAGELKFYPLDDPFRVSLGTPTFFFFLLWIRKIPTVLSGLLVGISVLAFRMGLDWSLHPDFQWVVSFRLHFPAFFYYLTYAAFFQLARIHHFGQRPLLVGALGILAETIASIVELSFRVPSLDQLFTWSTLVEIVIIATIRSFFVLSFFNIIQLRQAKLAEEQQRRQNERMMLLISGLYEESVQLKKSLQQAEEITKECYDLYRTHNELNTKYPSIDLSELAQKALRIAGQVHEIKKDNQRIYAGLAKMISDESTTDYMNITQIGEIIVRTNQKYAYYLEKNIQFSVNIEDSLPPFHVYTVLSLVNNLVANAVEAIQEYGMISIDIYKKEECLEFRILDNGVGIPPKKREMIFEPGYTTKYDVSGKSSTGIGLSYVREAVTSLKGYITLEDNLIERKTIFILTLPIHSIMQKG
ncbi:MAG TPA: sensor histidine kinase [Bacillota bacterium]|nr:sensor histidine kinase [Bacillota bacterium]